MTETTSIERADVPGAIGLPLAILAVVISVIPYAGILFFWAPGGAAVILGGAGIWLSRRGRGSRRLSKFALGIGLGSFAITGAWLLLGVILQTLVGAVSECFDC